MQDSRIDLDLQPSAGAEFFAAGFAAKDHKERKRESQIQAAGAKKLWPREHFSAILALFCGHSDRLNRRQTKRER